MNKNYRYHLEINQSPMRNLIITALICVLFTACTKSHDKTTIASVYYRMFIWLNLKS